MKVTELVLTTTDGEDVDILSELDRISYEIAQRTDDDNAQEWAADLNVIAAAIRGS